MTPERWRQVEQVFEAVVTRPAAERSGVLAALSGDDHGLRREVESLLAHAAGASAFLATPAFPAASIAGEPPLIGRRFGTYQVRSFLDAGGMGEVYRAHDERLGREVAIKILPMSSASNPERRARFEQEARLLAALNHPHIGAIYGIEPIDGRPALVLELVDGETLAERIATAPLPMDEALAIGKQIAEALEAAHERGIVHRDLKPANIRITPGGVVKVIDFGLAKTAVDAGLVEPSGPSAGPDQTPAPSHALVGSPHRTREGTILGTIAYMSPEQASGNAADRRADVWAFGVILFEMLTGRPVFAGDTLSDVLAAVLKSEPDWTTLPPETPAPIRTLLRRCLEKDRTRRPDSATTARMELGQALTTRTSQSAEWSRRTPVRAFAALAVITVLAVAAGGWRLWQQDYFWRNPLADAKVERLTDFEGEETHGAISPDGKYLTFLSDRDGRFDAWISRIGSGEFSNVTQGRFQLMNNPSTPSVGFSGDGAQVWFMQLVTPRPLRWTSWVYPLLGGAARPFVEGGLDPRWSPDGRQVVYHTNDLGDPIFIGDRNGNSARRIFVGPPGIHGHYLSWSPDGRFIYLVIGILPTEEMDIWRIPVSPGTAPLKPERITSHNARVAWPAWLDARTLIYSATAEDGSGQSLYAIDVERRIPHRVSFGVAEQYLSVTVSRTEPRRVVTTIAAPTASLWTVPISDSVQAEEAATRVPTPNTRALGPRFAGKYLAFQSSKGGTNGIWTREDGVAREIWRGDEGGVVAPPAPSPDGRLICFSARTRGTTRLYVVNANGTNARRLSDSLDVRGAASWSPDGKLVAIAANEGKGTRLFLIPVDGGQPVQLLDTLSFNPVWSPDGRFIMYSEQQRAGQFEVKAITPERVPVSIVELPIVGFTTAAQYRFLPDRRSLVVLEGTIGNSQNFVRVDLVTGQRRQLTALKSGSVIQNFDVSPDGTHIVFDRLRDNADIALWNLAR
jgi:serine/threonine protein kinase